MYDEMDDFAFIITVFEIWNICVFMALWWFWVTRGTSVIKLTKDVWFHTGYTINYDVGRICVELVQYVIMLIFAKTNRSPGFNSRIALDCTGIVCYIDVWSDCYLFLTKTRAVARVIPWYNQGASGKVCVLFCLFMHIVIISPRMFYSARVIPHAMLHCCVLDVESVFRWNSLVWIDLLGWHIISVFAKGLWSYHWYVWSM